MAKATPSTIILKSGGGDTGNTREGTVAAANTITPGKRVDAGATGVALAAGAVAGTDFAVEDSLRGNGITDDYAAASRITYRTFQRGDEVYAFLAGGQNVAVGAVLEGAASGDLTALASGVGVAEALEAVDNTGSPTPAAARIRVRII